MSNLMGSLGLDEVEADPNALPDGRWVGEVVRSAYVFTKSKNSIAHVITYRITEGERKGAERQEWFTIGVDPVFADGHDGDANYVTSVTPTQTEQNKQWYKKRFVDLGIPEDEVTSTDIASLVGKSVYFGTKRKDGYININFVELRPEGEGETVSESGAVTGLL